MGTADGNCGWELRSVSHERTTRMRNFGGCPENVRMVCGFCRILAVALVLDRRPRSEAAAPAGMDRQTLCDWVHRYNASGIGGLKSR